MQRFVKIFLILVGLLGLAVSVFSTEYRVGRIGHVLIMIAVLGRLLLYARNLRPGKTTARSLFTDQSQK